VERDQLGRSEQEARQIVLFLFLSHLGLGIVFTLVFVSREAGVKFFRFNAGLAAILIAVAFAFHSDPTTTPGRVAIVALAVAEGAIVVYWATVGRVLASIRPAIVVTAVAAGLVAIVGQAIAAVPDGTMLLQALTVASFLASAALLGGACTAMILGHWYLIIPSMQVSHLQSIVGLHIASLVVRVALVSAVVTLALGSTQLGHSELGPSFHHYITSVSGIFFWQRVLFGLAGPAVLSYLTWETAKIRSTQSATGILYVDFFTVVVGEVLAKYILLAMRVPV
jgi:protein NrfD